MKITLVILFSIFFTYNLYSQCDCEKIQRSDGIITQCKVLPVGGDNSLQIGLNLAYNGKDFFVATTIRYILGQPLKIAGDLSLRLVDNNLMTFTLVKTQPGSIGDSNVEFGIFLINENQFSKIENSKILTVTIILSDNKMHTIEATLNQDLLVNQSKCLSEYRNRQSVNRKSISL